MKCAIADCTCLPGKAKYTFGGPTIDEPLFFCKARFRTMEPIYTAYKTIENAINLNCFTINGKWPSKQDEIPYELIENLANVKLAIDLRESFQSRLRKEIRSDGHDNWMQRLRLYQIRLETTLEMYFDLWEKQPNKPGRRKVYSGAMPVPLP